MDPFMIMMIVGSVIGVADEIIKTVNRNKLRPIIKDLTDYVNKNQRFLSDLQEAYSEGNSKRINALFSTSPIGNAYRHLKNEIAETKRIYEEKKKQVGEQVDKAGQLLEQANSNMYSVGNSMLIDAIDSLSKSDAMKEESDKITNTDLINGGTNNV